MRGDGSFVLYWMTSARRVEWNFALDRAIAHAEELGRPLVILEALRVGYRWASDRIHRFVLEGMADNAARLRVAPVTYYPYVEPQVDAGKGLLRALASHACVVVTDDFPCFMIPAMTAAAASQLDVRMEAVDSNGLWPMRSGDRLFPSAHTFRRHLQKELATHLLETPRARPLARSKLPRLAALPPEIVRRWPPAQLSGVDAVGATHTGLAGLPIDHGVAPVEQLRGGATSAAVRWRAFAGHALAQYDVNRNALDGSGVSGLSPYLHFGHISTHQIFDDLARREDWSMDRLAPKATGSREGWWGMSAPVEAFLDQIVTWRELGFNGCVFDAAYDRYDSLPGWAQATLRKHAGDARPWTYSQAEFEESATHDPLWNAAQRQLRRDGLIHNYLRMLWGKKILEWSDSPEQALEVMVHLNNKYALDGRDPNSYSGIFWTLGRYDRPWGPERAIFGTVRYMSSENTARKMRLNEYLARYGAGQD